MRYLVAKQEALKECNYDIRMYILNNNYYAYTSKYQWSASLWLKRKLIFNLGCLFIALIGCVLFAVAIALSCLMVNNFSYFGWSVACYFIGILLMVIGVLTITIKSLMQAQKVAIVFQSLLNISAINSNLSAYPLLMQKFLATFAKLNINNQAFWYTPSTLTWELYVMIDFYHQLNMNYLKSSSIPLINQ